MTCQPASHPTCYERWAGWQANDGRAERAGRGWHGRFTAVTLDRSSHDGLLRGSDEAWSVNGFESTGVNANTGAQPYHNRLLPHHRLSAANIAAVAQAGRGRGKSDNAPHHVLQTTGSHREHNVGQGQQDLAAFLLRLNLLALLCPTVGAWSDEQ